MAIPKILHYCWFGGNPLTKETLSYMESWKKNCPDFEIKVWDETNFDIHCCKFVEEAYASQKWAFVADYARFYAMFHDGGVYVETDTEIIRPIDELLKYDAFFGFGIRTMTLPLCGTNNNNKVAELMLNYYNNKKSFFKDGEMDLTTVNQILFDVLKNNFNLIPNNEFQILDDNIAIYPKEYFFSTDWKTGIINNNKELFVIHHADASWLSESSRRNLRLSRRFIKIFGVKMGQNIANIIIFLRENGLIQTISKVLKKI